MQGSKCRTENSGAVRRVAAGGRTAVAAGRIDNPRMTMDKEVLFPGESKQTGPAPACTPQILSHSAFLFSAADCAGSVACASSDVAGDVSGDVQPMSQAAPRGRSARGRSRPAARGRGRLRFYESFGGYFFPGVVAGCTMPCLKCCSSERLQISSPMSHGFSLNIRLAVKD